MNLFAIRPGHQQIEERALPVRLKFEAGRDSGPILSNLRYIVRSQARLARVPNAIALVYEDLCDPEFSDRSLDSFFGRRIRLDDPKPPTSGASYVANWEEFRAFIDAARRRMADELPPRT